MLTFFQLNTAYWFVLKVANPIEKLNWEFMHRARARELIGGEISTYRWLIYTRSNSGESIELPSHFSMVRRIHTIVA